VTTAATVATAVTFATAMEAAATMGLSAAVEAVTTVELTAAVEVTTATVAVAAVEISAAIAAIESASVSAATVIPSPATVATVSAAVVAMSVAVEPGSGADEDTADEIIRSVEAVGRARVWSIVVVAVGANGSRAVIGRAAYSDAEGDALGLRVRGGEKTNSETNGE